MRIILLNLPWNERGRLGVRAGSRWPFTSLADADGRIHYIPFPFFLAYATSYLKKHEAEARILDAIAAGLCVREVIDDITLFNPELMVVETSTPSFDNDMRIIAQIRKENPGCQIALCGPHASFFAEGILERYDLISYVLRGEFEISLLDLVQHIEMGRELADVAGLAYRSSGKITLTELRRTIENLDGLPWPERETLPMYNYNDAFAGLPVPNAQMWASRGCPFKCNFCLWPQTMYYEHRYRKRNCIDVVNEMEFLVTKFGFKAVYFDDDVFNIEREYVTDICKEIKRRTIRVPWAIMARADLMDENLLEVMADAGLYAVKYGIESADEKMQQFCNKNLDLKKCFSVIENTKKQGVKVHLTFCKGFPGETEESIQKTLHFIQRASPDSVQFSYATPFPGTEYFRYAQEKGLLKAKNWNEYDGKQSCVIAPHDLKRGYLEEIYSLMESMVSAGQLRKVMKVPTGERLDVKKGNNG